MKSLAVYLTNSLVGVGGGVSNSLPLKVLWHQHTLFNCIYMRYPLE